MKIPPQGYGTCYGVCATGVCVTGYGLRVEQDETGSPVSFFRLDSNKVDT